MPEKKYKKYVISILCAFFILYGLSVVWVLTGYFCPKNDTFWVNHLYQKKEAYAQSIHEPKIVIVSGSSGLYGVSAEKIEQHFKIPTVNLSTHAGLRDYYYHRAKKTLRAGDLVILAPEYTQYFFDSSMSDVKSDYILNFDRSCLKNLPVAEQFQILKTYAHPWKIMRDGCLFFMKQKKGTLDTLCSSRVLNRNGDIVGGFGTKKYSIELISLMPGRFDPEKYGMKKFSGFIHWCETEGVQILVTWPGTPPLINTALNEPYSLFTDALMAFLSHSGVEILGQPKDFFMPESYMFDTIYHLNPEGIQFRTAKIIGLLESSPGFRTWRQRVAGEDGHVSQAGVTLVDTDVCYNGEMELAGDNNQVPGWRAFTGGNENPDGIAVPDNAEAHGGKHSLKLTNTSGGQVRWVGEKVALPAGIRKIHTGGWSKVENIEDSATYCINIKTFFKDGSFQWNTGGLFFSKGSHNWEQVQSVINFDKEVVAVQPFLILYSSVSGTAWFDDVFIRVQTAGKAGM
ncbi:MAG: hypothetical protein C4518_19725 [Desulfobacteraceae bacterium]|nr:MAG: hypothetical protein C4518_19725 [Desulfobacteraceae bacterium]